MGKDRNVRESDLSVNKENFSSELNFTTDGDDLFGKNNEEMDTFDMEQSNVGLTPINKHKENNLKEKENLGIMMDNFDHEHVVRGSDAYKQSFNENAIQMEKVSLQDLNEEEKLIERSRINEQREFLEKYEQDRLDLLRFEREQEDKMKYHSSIMTNEILQEENRAMIEVRENEARTFRHFAKREEKLKNRIYKDEGEIMNLKKNLHFSKSKARSHLFGGSRDRVYGLKWNQTPSPLEVKVLMARKVNEKLPKAHYALNISILDGFNGNEIFYKFSKDVVKDEYRDQINDYLIAKQKQPEPDEAKEAEDDPSSQVSGDDEDSEAVPARRLKEPKLVGDNDHDKLEFLKKTLKRLENNDDKNYMEDSLVDIDNKSIQDFLMPDIDHKRKMRNERHHEGEKDLQGDTTMKNNLLNQFKQVLINFQKNFSSLQRFDDPLKEEELEFSDKVYFMIPPDMTIEPSYIIMFELILLDEKLSSTSDRVVAWGAYPLLHRGKFKVPLILGKYDRRVDKFKDIEGRYIKNIDEWVCNLYFEMRDIRLVECFGHKEFLEFPIPSEIQAYLEGKIDEEKLKEIEEKRLEAIQEGEGEGDAEADIEKAIKKELMESKHDDENESNELSSRGEFGKLAEDSVMLNDVDNASESDDSDKSVYDIEGKHDIVEDLRTVDLRTYKYAIEKKLLFSMDDDEEIKKLRYIFKELLLDLGIGRFTFWPTLLSSIVMLVALWSRLYVHYLFQYIFLKAIDVPITNVTVKMYTVDIKYGFWNVYQEVVAVSSGVGGTTLMFCFMIFITWIGHHLVDYYPKVFSKFVVWFGFGTLGDGVLCAIVDTATRNGDGDFYKLPDYYNNAEDSPIAGYIVVVCIYLFFIVLNLLIFYNYVVFLHLNGRMQDIYIRLLGDPRVFFCPNDNELSLRHLLWCYYTAIVNSQRIVVNNMTLDNDYGESKTLTTMQTSDYETSVSLEIMRTFIRDEQGCIKELTEKEISYLNAKETLPLTSLLAKVPTKKSREFRAKLGDIEAKNLALQNIEDANPYRNKVLEHEKSQIESILGEDSVLQRRKSKAGKVSTFRDNVSGLRRNTTMMSRKSSGRRGSLLSKKSYRSNKSKQKPTKFGRKMTYIRKKSALGGLRGVSMFNKHKENSSDILSQRSKGVREEPIKYL